MFVGGEFYYDQNWISDHPTLSTEGMLFLNGGKACLMAISGYLLAQGIDRILVPDYLCPSILTTLERCGLTCEDYQVNEDLSINMEDLAPKATRSRAVYLINYFGFLHSPKVRAFFKHLRQKGVIVVEDNAQAGFHNHPTGDFIFNSLRKFTPYDGGYLITPHDVSPYLEPYRTVLNRRLGVIRAYRAGLARYLLEGEGDHSQLEDLYTRAEQYYDSDPVILGDPQEHQAIERLDWAGIKQARRENYAYLLSLIASIPEVKPIYPALQAENMPLGLPVYLSGVSRDRVCEELASAEIGLTVHWDEILRHPHTRNNPRVVDMARRMLTLVIDQRHSRKQMEYLALKLAGAVAAAGAAG